TLYRFIPAWKLPDLSPFVVKLETYLKMAKVPYEPKIGDPRKAPKGKLPYIEHEGRLMGDSTIAIEHLKTAFGDPLDRDLGPKERAVAQAFKSMLEEHLYFVVLYQRWKLDEGWAHYVPVMTELLGKAGVPGLLRGFMLGRIRAKTITALQGQGHGRHAPEEIDRMGRAIVAAVGDYVGDGPFFFGAKPASIDATIYAFLVSLVDAPFAGAAKDEVNARPNLVAYVERMKKRYWS